MRDILFRGKRMDNGEWIIGRSLLRFYADEDECYIPAVGELAELALDEDDNIVRIDAMMIPKVDPSSVGQFTGFLDKSGTKIFEGDILAGDHYPYTSDGVKNYYAIVEWYDFGPGFYLTLYKAPGSSVCGIAEGDCFRMGDACCPAGLFSVIGNVKDNPDLVPDYML